MPTRVSARVSAITESATLAVDAKAKALKAAGRPVIPVEIAARNGVDLEDILNRRGSAALRAAVGEVAATADAHLRAARGARHAIPRAALPQFADYRQQTRKGAAVTVLTAAHCRNLSMRD